MSGSWFSVELESVRLEIEDVLARVFPSICRLISESHLRYCWKAVMT